MRRRDFLALLGAAGIGSLPRAGRAGARQLAQALPPRPPPIIVPQVIPQFNNPGPQIVPLPPGNPVQQLSPLPALGGGVNPGAAMDDDHLVVRRPVRHRHRRDRRLRRRSKRVRSDS